MNRALLPGLVFFLLIGCALPPEQVPLKPLPENGPPQTYADLVTRARLQATAANEAFYVNNWMDLEDAARGLEQTARFLSKTTDVPLRHKDTLAIEAGDLGKEAAQLREAARDKDDKKANQSLQRLNLQVRQLRAGD
jgi:hypothetical protein